MPITARAMTCAAECRITLSASGSRSVSSFSLTVVADKATVSKVQEGDVNVTPSKLTVLNFGNSPVDLSAAKQNTIRLPNNIQGSVATDGSAPAKRDPANTLTGAWRVDALVDGDGVKALGKRR